MKDGYGSLGQGHDYANRPPGAPEGETRCPKCGVVQAASGSVACCPSGHVYSRSGRYFGWIGQDAAEHNGGLVIALAAEVERLTPPRAPDEGAREGDVTAADRLFSIVSAVMGSGRGADCAAEWTQVDEIASNIRLAAPAPSPDVSEPDPSAQEILAAVENWNGYRLHESGVSNAERMGFVLRYFLRHPLRTAARLAASESVGLAASAGQQEKGR